MVKFCEKYNDNLICDTGSNGYGYVVGKEGDSMNYYVDTDYIISTEGFKNSLYFNNSSTSQYNCTGYWIVAPSDYPGIDNSSGAIMVINNNDSSGNNGIGYRGLAAPFYGIRPVICLKAKINGNFINGEWQLQ